MHKPRAATLHIHSKNIAASMFFVPDDSDALFGIEVDSDHLKGIRFGMRSRHARTRDVMQLVGEHVTIDANIRDRFFTVDGYLQVGKEITHLSEPYISFSVEPVTLLVLG